MYWVVVKNVEKEQHVDEFHVVNVNANVDVDVDVDVDENNDDDVVQKMLNLYLDLD